MTTTTEEKLKILNDKLQLLVKKYGILKKENNSLTAALNESQLRENASQENIARLEMETSILKASAGKMDDKERVSFEKQINHYIKDLEKCMTLLNK
ncbi:MAG: hypothetical protein ABIN25_11645 [Ginsengibacter sp.]